MAVDDTNKEVPWGSSGNALRAGCLCATEANCGAGGVPEGAGGVSLHPARHPPAPGGGAEGSAAGTPAAEGAWPVGAATRLARWV